MRRGFFGGLLLMAVLVAAPAWGNHGRLFLVVSDFDAAVQKDLAHKLAKLEDCAGKTCDVKQ